MFLCTKLISQTEMEKPVITNSIISHILYMFGDNIPAAILKSVSIKINQNVNF